MAETETKTITTKKTWGASHVNHRTLRAAALAFNQIIIAIVATTNGDDNNIIDEDLEKKIRTHQMTKVPMVLL